MTLVNLNKARKERDRAEAKTRADQNAVKFGQTKAERIAAAAREKTAAARLDQHKFDE